MSKFTVIPQSTFNELQVEAGVLLSNFDPLTAAAPADADIICATSGGINPSLVPTYSDFGEDIDNVPANTKELRHLDSWEAKLAFTTPTVSLESIKLAVGAADQAAASSTAAAHVTPRRDLSQSDFQTIWWVGDLADGGMVAIKLTNALSTGGFSLQTSKAGKGMISIELTGHVSIDAQDVVPMEFYWAAGE